MTKPAKPNPKDRTLRAYEPKGLVPVLILQSTNTAATGTAYHSSKLCINSCGRRWHELSPCESAMRRSFRSVVLLPSTTHDDGGDG